ncbi:hypothetical protein ACFFGH_07295 [Lysobacter korlensis]|uniref:EF-hand domain-containing protein n=1 Tax=Lysobacter korlensis TaxID=553636 RepID=A0ABV6RKY9_9GAMM
MRITRLATLGLAVILASGCAAMPFGLGDADVGFAEWDMDGNGLIGNDEFRMGFDKQDWFDVLDKDNNNMLSNGEFASASAGWGLDSNAFVNWDANRDGVLSDDEFGEGAFGVWDKNDDGLLDDDEFGFGVDWFD